MRDFGRRLDDLDPEFMGLGLVFRKMEKSRANW
jgi:hypothetical protein